MKSTSANLLLLLAGAIWGLGFIAQQTAMDDVGPMFFVGSRFVLAAVAILPLALMERRRSTASIRRIHGLHFVGVGLLFFLAMAMQQIGLLRTTVTNAGFLTVLYVVIVPILAWLFLREPQPLVVWLSAIICVGGVYFLSSGNLSNLNWGDLCVLIGAAIWACHVIVVGRVSRNAKRPIAMAATQFVVCGVLGLAAESVLVVAGLSQWPSYDAMMGAATEILYAGIVSGGIAFTLQAVAQRYTSASIAAILMASESLFAALLGATILHERLTVSGYLGCAMIFGSILAAEWFCRRSQNEPDIPHSVESIP